METKKNASDKLENRGKTYNMVNCLTQRLLTVIQIPGPNYEAQHYTSQANRVQASPMLQRWLRASIKRNPVNFFKQRSTCRQT